MIVKCEHCQTKYRIADAKVKGKGVKVRCAKCENVFTVTPSENDLQTPATSPQVSESRDAAAPESPPSTSSESEEPEGTQGGGLPAPSPHAGEKPPPDLTQGAAEAPPGLPPLPPLDGQQGPSAADDVQPPADTGFGEGTSVDHAPPLPDEAFGDPGSQRPAHEIDQTGLFSPPADPAEQGVDGGFEIEATLRDGAPTEPAPIGSEETDGLPPLSQEADPEGEWGNIPIDGQEAPDSADGDFGLAGESGYVAPQPVPFEEPIVQDGFDHNGNLLQETSTVPTYQPEIKSSGGGKKAIGILLLLAALGGGGYFAYPTVMEMIQARTQPAEGTLTPANVKVKALNRSDGKLVYSVRGVVKNESAGNVGMIQVEAQFRNASGDVLSKATSYCGNLFEDSDLVSLDLKKVRSDLQNELGQSLSNANITPGQAVPFLVILDNPPVGINKVTVTISSFKETT